MTCDSDYAKCSAMLAECEQRSYRYLKASVFADEQLRLLLTFLDYHRARSERRAYIEQVREKIAWIIATME